MVLITLYLGTSQHRPLISLSGLRAFAASSVMQLAQKRGNAARTEKKNSGPARASQARASEAYVQTFSLGGSASLLR